MGLPAIDIGDLSRFEGKTLNDYMPVHEKFWWHYPYIRKLNFMLMCAMLTQITSGFDGSMLNGLQSLSTWTEYFGHPKGGKLGSMTNGVTYGVLIMTPFVSTICDRWGRRLPISIGSATIIVGAVLQGAAQAYPMFVVARFLLGMGICLSGSAAPLLLIECAYPAQRGKMTSFIEPAWPIGSFVAAAITYGTFHMGTSSWSWRIPSLLQCFFPIVQCVLSLFSPESPRWLIMKDRHEEAYEFFVRYHAGGDRESEMVKFQMAEVTATLEAERAADSNSWSTFFKTKGMRHRFLIATFVPAMMQLSGNAIMSYYLSRVLTNIGVTDQQEQLTVNLAGTAWGIVTAYTFASQVDRIGRRKGFLFGLISMQVSYIVWTIMSAVNQERGFNNRPLAIGIIAVMYIYQGFYHLTAPFAPTYVTEVVPYSLRAKGSMLYQLCGNIVGVFNNYVNPIAMDAIQWKYYIVYCVWIGVEAVVVYFFFPETGGKSLEEIAEVFDGPDANVGIHAIALERDYDVEKMAEIEHVDLVEKKLVAGEHLV
ncbi:general substrate transporter [Kockiozyma suomiensis]|uniref:general substrate transporter n=1 Tax=Kockiozyma suomiensis TaxID=1337062 RepID=UPI00334410B8